MGRTGYYVVFQNGKILQRKQPLYADGIERYVDNEFDPSPAPAPGSYNIPINANTKGDVRLHQNSSPRNAIMPSTSVPTKVFFDRNKSFRLDLDRMMRSAK